MAFTIAPITTLKVNVQIAIPADAGAKSQRADFTVQFKKRPVSEQKELHEQLNDKDIEVSDDDVLLSDIVDIEGLMDSNGQPIEYSPDVLEKLLEMDYVRKPLMESWMQLYFGKDLLRLLKEKNSRPLASIG